MAIVIGAGIAAAGAVAGGAMSASGAKSASKSASNAATSAADKELALQREARAEARQVLTPYSQEGAAARRLYNAAMGIAPSGGGGLDEARADYDAGFEASPYWRDAQYGTERAMNALLSTNAALGRGGSINSGKALRAASDIQGGYRGQATQNYLAGLSGIADTGMVADSGIASGGQVFANNASNAIRHAAGLTGQYGLAGAQASANAWGGVASDVAGLAGYALGNYRPGGQNYFATVQPVKAQPLPSYTPPAMYSGAVPVISYGGG